MSNLGKLTIDQEDELLEHFQNTLSVQKPGKISVWPTDYIAKHNFMKDLVEREIKILEIDVWYVLQKIYEFQPTLTFSGIVEDNRYDFTPGSGMFIEETMRIRKKWETFYLTIKRKNTTTDIKSREEFEVSPINIKRFEEKFAAMGLVPVHLKDKVRQSFDVWQNGMRPATMDLDLYYGIPPLLEIEWATKDIIRSWIKRLGLEKHKLIVPWSARQTLDYYEKQNPKNQLTTPMKDFPQWQKSTPPPSKKATKKNPTSKKPATKKK